MTHVWLVSDESRDVAAVVAPDRDRLVVALDWPGEAGA